MTVVHRRIDELKHSPTNARKHSDKQLERLGTSLMQYGWTLPLLVADDVVIAGNGRLEAAQLLVMSGQHELAHGHDASNVPTVDVSHMDDIARREYEILDNKLHDESSWDVERLKSSLHDIHESMTAEHRSMHDSLLESVAKSMGMIDESRKSKQIDDFKEHVIVVRCTDETHQRATYEFLLEQGYDVVIE